MYNLKKIFIFIFLCSIILPNCFLVLGINSHLDENRVLQEKPEFEIKNILDYPAIYTKYYEDNMPFKDFLVKCNAYLNYYIFGISAEKSVICGKEGWLFYNSKYKEKADVLEDYISSVPISQEELEDCKDTLLEMKEVCEREGAEFVFMIAPNKMTIYGNEYMPDLFFRNSEISKTDVLVDYLKENSDICIVYPKEELLQLRDNVQLYYKLDSHWNALGGYVGYSVLYRQIFDKAIPEIASVDYTYEEINYGDLAKILNITHLADIKYNMAYASDIQVERWYESEIDLYSTSDSLNDKKLLMFRDSFATALEDYIQRDFASTHLKWSSVFEQMLVIQEQPDIVIYEMVERCVPFISEMDHIYADQWTENTILDMKQLPIYTNKKIIGWSIPEERDNLLCINGFGFISDVDSKQTHATIMLVGETVYESMINLEYRNDVIEAYNAYDNIGYSGINVELELDNIKSGNYNVYLVLENKGTKYYWNMDYIISR